MSEKNGDLNKDLVKLINSKIESLRPKLLDFGRRNPLISTKFSDRSHSHIRVVDELPEMLLEKLSEDKMEVISLPPLEEDPKNEKTEEFQSALSDARITDEEFQDILDSIDQDSENSAEQLMHAERDLKDKIRDKLGMRPRQTKANLSLADHARNHDIEPSYDLPLPNELNSDGRHVDNKIQTLLLPDLMERRLNSMLTKCNSWIQETGINVLKAAFGFWEWKEDASSKPSLAPLIMLPVSIEKKKTPDGYQFYIKDIGDGLETNTVLVEKLNQEFGITMPTFDPETMTIEEYFEEIGKIRIRGVTCKVRRQIAIGVFPSARMAMYHDLDTKKWNFTKNSVIQNLFGGGGSGGATPFGDDYDVDDPEIEKKVPNLVMDADSSQFSTIVDIVDNKNLAVEGPPGTGKSQTIVNTIAAALTDGKKVLFVAEKMAALEVVRSRLEACGLGEFLHTLQATRSTKEKVISSLRERVSMRNQADPKELNDKIAQFKRIRKQLDRYIHIITKKHEQTDKTVHDVIGWGIQSRIKLSKKFSDLSRKDMIETKHFHREEFENILYLCDQLEKSWKKAKAMNPHWRIVNIENLDPYKAENILEEVKESCVILKECCSDQPPLVVPTFVRV